MGFAQCVEPWVLLIYAEWCPLCRELEVIWHEVAEDLCASGIRVGETEL